MKIRYLKLKNWLLASLMGTLGLSACCSQKEVVSDKRDTINNSSHDRDDQHVKLYGVPVRDYEVRPLDIDPEPDTNASKVSPQAKNDPEPEVEPREPQVTVYGVPTVNYKLKGRVVNANGAPIKGVQVALLNSDYSPDIPPEDEGWNRFLGEIADTTDAQGQFNVQATDRPWSKLNLIVRDIDGSKNGSTAGTNGRTLSQIATPRHNNSCAKRKSNYL